MDVSTDAESGNTGSNFGRDLNFAEDNAATRGCTGNIPGDVGLSSVSNTFDDFGPGGVSASVGIDRSWISRSAPINAVANTAESNDHTKHNNTCEGGWGRELAAAIGARVNGDACAAFHIGGRGNPKCPHRGRGEACVGRCSDIGCGQAPTRVCRDSCNICAQRLICQTRSKVGHTNRAAGAPRTSCFTTASCQAASATCFAGKLICIGSHGSGVGRTRCG